MNKQLTEFIRSVMRISTIVVILMCLAGSLTYAERGHAQRLGDYKLSLSIANESLHAVLVKISERTRVSFAYDQQALLQVTVAPANYRDEPLDKALQSILAGTGYQYEVMNRNVVISKKPIPKPQRPGKITGHITDAQTGEPLEGVTVQESTTGKTGLTDASGNYALELMPGVYRLAARYVGYEAFSQSGIRVEDGKSTDVNFVLTGSTSELDEVVVIGYGEVRKSDLTGSVGQVNVEDMQKAPVATFDQALAGRVAGVQVSGNDGQPGAQNQIVIRGNNSLTQSNEPLYVIDGYPVESFEELPVSPSDIESMQVLKDASATSIYGARGANGVIIITTKKGLNEQPVISVNSHYGIQDVTKLMDMLSPYEFVKYQYELIPERTERLYLQGQEKTLDDYRNIQGNNVQEALYQSAPFFNADVGFRGGNGKTQYAVFANTLRSEGVITNSGYNRTQGKLSLTQELHKNIKAYVNAGYTKSKTWGSIISENTGGIASLSKIYSALGYRPVSGDDIDLTEELYDPAVLEETPTDYRVNPVISAKNEIDNRVLSTAVINGYLDVKLGKNLFLKISGGITENSRTVEDFYNSKTQKGNPDYPTSKGTTGGMYEQKTQNWLNENTLRYNAKIGNHRINALAGVTLQERKFLFSGYTAEFIEDESLGIDGIDVGTSLIPSTYRKEWSLGSFLSRVNYDYKTKYLLTVSFRADGSSKFMGNNKWGYFPSAAFAWRMNKEPFLKHVKQLSDLKLRMSYGTTGNNRVDEYATYSGVIFPVEAYYSFRNGTPVRGASLRTSAGTADLKWETTTQFNTGLDISLFNNRLSFVFDYYSKTTDDLLLNANLPYTTGYLTAFQNIGSVRNRGLEFTLQTQNIKRNKFSWNTSFNISFNRNKVLKLQDEQPSRLSTVSFAGGFTNVAPYIAQVSEPMGLMYGAIFDRLYQYEDFNVLPNGAYELKEDISGNGQPRNAIQPGDRKFVDVNNDGTINTEDYTVIGNGNPAHLGGIINDLRFGSFDMSIFLQWSHGHDIINANRLYFEDNVLNLYNFNLYSSTTNRWSPDNQQTTIPRAGSASPIIYHSDIIEDGSYLRLKTISLGYNLSGALFRRLNVRAVRAYISAQNVYTFTRYSGSDPEVSVRNSALTPGFDWSAYPRARTLTIGLNVSF